MSAGRPTNYKPEYCQMLIEHMGSGLSFESFAAVVDVHRDTLYEWCTKHFEFSDAKNRGRMKQLEFYEKFGRSAMAGKIEGFNATAFVWMTKNMLGWRDRQEITGANGESLAPQINIHLTDRSDRDLLEQAKTAIKILETHNQKLLTEGDK